MIGDILFVNVGWTENYDGNERPVGSHRYLKQHSDDCSEMFAFKKVGGAFTCGIGRGATPSSFDLVVVAMDPLQRIHRIVGIYRNATSSEQADSGSPPWGLATARQVHLIPVSSRPRVKWPRGTNIRRWARNHPNLKATYVRLLKSHPWTAGASEKRAASKAISAGLGGDVGTQSIEDLPPEERKRVRVEIERVLRDARLRPLVLKHWPPRCAACGLKMEDTSSRYECEVAHVVDVHLGGMDQLRNAMPLCRTHHWAFDRDLWAIEPSTLKIAVLLPCRSTRGLREIHGKSLRGGRAVDILSRRHIQTRWDRFITHGEQA